MTEDKTRRLVLYKQNERRTTRQKKAIRNLKLDIHNFHLSICIYCDLV